MSQNDFLNLDLLIPTTDGDILQLSKGGFKSNPPPTKREGHTFSSSSPNGICHRAFSAFLFNGRGDKMLITKRAGDKITFPSVWTNAVCSHPLLGMVPDEVDNNDDVTGIVKSKGVKLAAVRKIKHELGIDGLDIDNFRFLTRYHYWSPDTTTYGQSNPQWGEHEVDYVLFYKLPAHSHDEDDHYYNLDNLNEEEVSDTMYVTANELKTMLGSNQSKDGLLFSPWFRSIMDTKGFDYWREIENISMDDGEVEYSDSKVRMLGEVSNDWKRGVIGGGGSLEGQDEKKEGEEAVN
jgi:isopentenyl-diphosphate delta-isomerase